MNLDLHVPTRIHFGRGRLAELGALTRPWGGSALLVCGRSAARRHGSLTAAVSALEGAGVRVTVVDDVSPNPLAAEVDRAVAAATRASCDVVVGLGGGSALDAAKATAVALRHGPCAPLVGRTLDPVADPVPVVAVPTTAGSGAEVTRGAIVTDAARNLKAGIRGEDVFPRVALVDPALSATAPDAVAGASAFDALAHAVEGHVARKANAITEAVSGRALEILGRRLPELLGPRRSDAALDDVALAALLGGLAVATASTCLPHRLQQAMGSVPRVPVSHGDGLAALYPAWLRRAVPHAPDRFAQVAALLGAADPEEGTGRIAAALGVRRGLGAHGFGPDDVATIAAGVVGNVDNDPMPDTGPDVLRGVLTDALV